MKNDNQKIIIGIAIIIIAIAVGHNFGLFATVAFSNQCSLEACPSGYSETSVSCDSISGVCTRNCQQVVQPSCGAYTSLGTISGPDYFTNPVNSYTNQWTSDDYEMEAGYCYKTQAYAQWSISGMNTDASKTLTVYAKDDSDDSSDSNSQTVAGSSAIVAVYTPEVETINRAIGVNAGGKVRSDYSLSSYTDSELMVKLIGERAVYNPGGTYNSQRTCTYQGCTPSWVVGDWTACSNGTQTRTVTDANSCGDNTGKPIETQSCTVTCTPNWNCTDWNTCPIAGTQTRTCSDSNSCGVTTGMPTQNQTCDYTCVPDWQTTSWTACVSGNQIRNVTDSNNCNSILNKPAVSQSCACTPNWQTGSWTSCLNGTQTRTVTDSNNCNVLTNKPAVAQSCTITNVTNGTSCTPSWVIGNWSACNNNIQTRSVTDSKNCSPLLIATTIIKPSTSQTCSVTVTGFGLSKTAIYWIVGVGAVALLWRFKKK